MSEGLPPHNLEAERATIAACIQLPNVRRMVAGKLTEDDFYLAMHRDIFRGVLQMHCAGTAIDIVTLAEYLRAKGRPPYVADIVDMHNMNVKWQDGEAHADIVYGLSVRRRLIKTAQHIAAEGYVGTISNLDFMTFCSKQINGVVREASSTQGGPETVKTIFKRQFQAISEGLLGKGPVAIPTGVSTFDAITGGLFPTDLVIMAARPGGGKSAAALSLAIQLAKTGHGVAFFSLEMSKEQLVERIVCHEAGIPMDLMRRRQLSPQQVQQIAQLGQSIADLPIHIEDKPGLNTEQIAFKAEEIAQKLHEQGKELKLIIVDYIQLIKPVHNKAQNRALELDAIAYDLKTLAKQMKCTVLAPAQFNRQADNADNKPSLSWLKESSGIEQAADTVVFLLDSKDQDQDYERRPMQWFIAKQRNGQSRCAARVWFYPQFTRFEGREDAFSQHSVATNRTYGGAPMLRSMGYTATPEEPTERVHGSEPGSGVFSKQEQAAAQAAWAAPRRFGAK